MLQLLQILGLVAAAGITLPVLIHLWNKREGKILKIGSVRLLVETTRQQARSLRIKDLWLLLLRCSIIFLLAVFLARPVWQKPLRSKDKKGWLVLDWQTRQAYKNYKQLIDSLVLAGFEPHRFSTGFPALNPADTTEAFVPTDTLPYWALLKTLNEKIPNDLPVFLFTSNKLNKFSGQRPLMAMNIRWLTYLDTDTTTGNNIAARLLSSDSVEVIVAHSTANYTACIQQNIAVQKSRQMNTTQLPATMAAGNNSTAVKVDTNTLKIGIVADPFSADAAYIEAALNAIRQFGKYRMQIEKTNDPGKQFPGYDWVFWLSQKPVPDFLKKSNLFLYENGREQSIYSWLQDPSGTSDNTGEVSVTKVVRSDKPFVGETIWSSGYGEPILSREKTRTTVYHFYSRFDPAWNGLVWSEAFPQILFNLILKKEGIKNVKDHRIIYPQQMQPQLVAANKWPLKADFLETTDLSEWAWAMAFMLFALERIISLNPKKVANA